MGRRKAKRKPPSRKHYEDENPTVSFRLDRDTKKRLGMHLEGTGCSFAGFIKDSLGREESMVEKRVKALASRQLAPSSGDKIRCLEGLVHGILCSVPEAREQIVCPRCDEYLIFSEGIETEPTLGLPWVVTWKCRKCGFFVDTYARIDPKSIKYDPGSLKEIKEREARIKKRQKKER